MVMMQMNVLLSKVTFGKCSSFTLKFFLMQSSLPADQDHLPLAQDQQDLQGQQGQQDQQGQDDDKSQGVCVDSFQQAVQILRRCCHTHSLRLSGTLVPHKFTTIHHVLRGYEPSILN